MGAGQKGRVKELFTRLLIAEACVGAAALLIAEVFPGALIRIFGAANESVYYTEFAVKSFRIYLCMTVLACVNKATFIFMQAMEGCGISSAFHGARNCVRQWGLRCCCLYSSGWTACCIQCRCRIY